jgi:CRISPR-associated protein Csx14
MMTDEPKFWINVDIMNPGQFFACCGLLELAHRLWDGAEGWFEGQTFYIAIKKGAGTLEHLLGKITAAELRQLDPDDDYSAPIEIELPFNLRLDWWTDEQYGGKRLKVWAGSMRNVRIARALQSALRERVDMDAPTILSYGAVVYEPGRPEQKVEPFYFDSRRGSYSKSIDIGFMPDTLNMPTIAYPATELLCLVGLQRCRPAATDTARVFDYFTWAVPLPSPITPAASCGLLPAVGAKGFRFENAFRTGQKKHKCFLNAIPLGGRI